MLNLQEFLSQDVSAEKVSFKTKSSTLFASQAKARTAKFDACILTSLFFSETNSVTAEHLILLADKMSISQSSTKNCAVHLKDCIEEKAFMKEYVTHKDNTFTATEKLVSILNETFKNANSKIRNDIRRDCESVDALVLAALADQEKQAKAEAKAEQTAKTTRQRAAK